MPDDLSVMEDTEFNVDKDLSDEVEKANSDEQSEGTCESSTLQNDVHQNEEDTLKMVKV